MYILEKKRRYLSERQAWLKMARLWSKPKLYVFGEEYVAEFDDLLFWGLCRLVGAFEQLDLISFETEQKMRYRIKKELQRLLHKSYGYIWPHTPAGAKARAAFCRRMAKKLTRKPETSARVCARKLASKK